MVERLAHSPQLSIGAREWFAAQPLFLRRLQPVRPSSQPIRLGGATRLPHEIRVVAQCFLSRARIRNLCFLSHCEGASIDRLSL
ncbi:MAG TPA: hypothetical protein VLI40_04615, partial [Gemmatimonadaceae bacterium]|nr:hypothetical protein [Gemmatimonadaceae bacterium]